MSVHAGTILHLSGNNIFDRLQRAGLGDVEIPTEVIREVGNTQIVDKVPGDPDFTFTLETLDVSTELEAMMTGGVASTTASANAAGTADAAGTLYDLTTVGFINIASPWKLTGATASAGTVQAGHLVPGYHPTRIRYRFGVTDNAGLEVELRGGSYYYAMATPVEQFATGNGATAAYPTGEQALPYRIGGAEGTAFKSIFGVIVDGVLQTEGVDYTQSPSNTASAGTATLTFAATSIPANGADIRFSYFSTAAHAFPQSVHASSIIKPAAVRGRHICVWLGSGGTRTKLGSVQSATAEFSLDYEIEREFCNEEIVGITLNGTDANGEVVVRSKSAVEFMAALEKVTGVNDAEVIGFLNTHRIPLEIQILNPRDPASVLKTLYVPDAIFKIPGTGAQVNTPTDFNFRWESAEGLLHVYKGQKA